MLLNAAFVPPDWVQEELVALTTRLVPVLGGIEDLAVRPFLLPITGFGNLTTPDAGRVVGALAAALTELEDPAPLVRFSTPTITPGGDIRIGLSGEVERLGELARFVPVAAARLRLYVDRRRFWPGLTLGRTGAPTAALDGLADWVGSDWRAETVSILRRVAAGVTVHAEIGIGASSRL